MLFADTHDRGPFLLDSAAKIAARDLRASPAKFLFVVVAVAIGVAALTGVKGFGFAFKGMLLRNAKQLIAADLQAQLFSEPTPAQIKRMQDLAGNKGSVTRVTETISMAGSSNQHVPQMVSVKGVDPAAYPFYGKLSLHPSVSLRELLASDEDIVVTPELLMRLKVQRGDTIRLGGKEFRITGTLTAEPDRLASGFGPGMRIIVSRAGLERTGLVQFGSRAAQRFLFRLGPSTDLDALKNQIRSSFPRVFISDYRQGSPAVGRAIDETTTFLSLISLIALIVGSLGVAMAMYSHLQQRMDAIAIMKALGARSPQIMQIYLLQTLSLGVAGGVIGVGIGALVQKSFPLLIRQLFSLLPDVPWDWSFSVQGLCLGVLGSLLFTIPPLLSVRNVRPSLVFRRSMAEAESESRKHWREKIPAAVSVAVIFCGFTCIAVWLSGSLRMGLYFMGGLTASLLLLSALAMVLLWTMRRIVLRLRSGLPSILRHGLANIYRPGNQARSVLVALGIGVMFTACTYLIQSTVLRDVKAEGPGREGNLFLLDVRDPAAVDRLIKAQPGAAGDVQFVGYIVARMISNNGTPIDQLRLTKQRKDQSQTARITTAEALPQGLEIKNGSWWTLQTEAPQLAVSEQAAHDFHISMRDVIRFQIAGKLVEAPVVAIFRRQERAPVRYDLVFPKAALKGLPVVYYGAAHIAPAQIPAVEEAVFEKFPTVTVMNLADVLQRIQEAVDQVAVVIRFLALFAIFAGVVILCSSVAGTRYRRIREVAILKTVGGTRARIAAIFSVEFSILGAVAGLIGGLLANLFTKIISDRFIDAAFTYDSRSILIAAVSTALLTNIAGWLASARILNQRPLEVLRGE